MFITNHVRSAREFNVYSPVCLFTSWGGPNPMMLWGRDPPEGPVRKDVSPSVKESPILGRIPFPSRGIRKTAAVVGMPPNGRLSCLKRVQYPVPLSAI